MKTDEPPARAGDHVGCSDSVAADNERADPEEAQPAADDYARSL
jgi:hypothetical protein